MKQTAVDWLVNEMPVIDWQDPYWKIKLDKAKAMEKKQIVKFSKVVLKEYKWIRPEELSTIKRLYNETFNTNN
jgi:hypothetical protein